MWYMIQVKTGEEQKLKLIIERRLEPKYYRNCIIPLCESVRRRKDKCLIMVRRLFPGYMLIDTDNPEEVHKVLKDISDFKAILGTKENNDSENIFVPIDKEDEEFYKSILDNGIMRVSYVHLSETNRIDKVFGPLENYYKYITKMEYRHRFATIEAEIHGKHRKLSFGLWGDGDPRLPWIEERKQNLNRASSDGGDRQKNELTINVGDKIIYPEVYGEQIFTVDSINQAAGIVHSTIKLFGCEQEIEMFADDVRKVG